MGREHYTLLKSSLPLGGFQFVVSRCSARFTSCHPIRLRLGSWLNGSEKVPPETAGNLFPGKWEADLGQGHDTHVESHNRHTYRHRSQTAAGEKGTLRLDTLLGANSGGKELSTMSSVRTSELYPVTCCYPEHYTFFVLPKAAKSGHFSVISRLAVVVRS